MRPYPLFALAGLLLAISPGLINAATWVETAARPGSFPLVANGRAAPVIVSPSDYKVVEIATHDLVADIARVSGLEPELQMANTTPAGPVVLIGTLGRNPLIDRLVTEKKVDVGELKGAWESFVIADVANPFPGVVSALVIVGSDRRGTAYGAYELSQAIGVSPWQWWADVTPEKKAALFVAAGTRRFGPPSVKYRGIFLNDEDWGLQPWAAKTFEPETGDIGPKTYAKIFELMLRLKANTVWPAMHACTRPFNSFPENKRVADDYAIVMGSSHAEPMLRNNVGEWKEKPELYNYVTNREGVRSYWEERVRENGRYENIYTLGMRGVHDSGIQGARNDAERIQILEQTFADQRAMIARHVRPEVEQVPQMFCAYKEVLGLYRQGLKVPDDVTIVWPDDNHGYIRNFATDEERRRRGGFGVYYHLSYLGAPMSYLWLCTTPPALVWEEMSKAYDYGARTIWIANVGDLKPAEIGTEFFLQLAWDINRWNRANLPEFLPEWAGREFGADNAKEIGSIMADYFRLNYQRRPEHLQWWMPRETPRPSPLTEEESAARLKDFDTLWLRSRAVGKHIARERQDAFFELVSYPVEGSVAANRRYFNGEAAGRIADADSVRRKLNIAQTDLANVELRNLLWRYDRMIGGKWRGMAYLEPADDQWRSFRLSKWEVPKFADSPPPSRNASGDVAVGVIEPEHFSRKLDRGGATWEIIPGLGRSGDSVAIFPTTMAAISPERAQADAPRLEFRKDFSAAGTLDVTVYIAPTFPTRGGAGLRFAIGIDDQPPHEVVIPVRDGSAEWAQGVLDAALVGHTKLEISSAGVHTVQLYGTDPGVVIDKLVLATGPLPVSYLGPRETKSMQ